MEENHYYRISDVASLLNLKSHVIRNWESELGIETPRSDSGYRVYTKETVQLLFSVKKLKDKGFSLKQIRLLLPNMDSIKNADDKALETLRCRLNSCQISEDLPSANQLTNLHINKQTSLISTENLESFREIMKDIITDALSENIDALSKEIGGHVSEIVSKEMNYQLIQHENIINDRIKAMENVIKHNSHSHKKKSYLGLRSRFANLVSSDCHFN